MIPPFSSKIEKRLSKSPKGYILDSGLACFLCGIFSEDSLKASPLLSALFEGYVISEFVKLLSSFSIPAQLYHFRTAQGEEVDLVIDTGTKLIPIEIKCSATLKSN